MKQNTFLFLIAVTMVFFTNKILAVPLDQMLPSERNNVEVFQKASPKVIYVHRLTTMINNTSKELVNVRSGAGTGIIWDSKGHILTNYHVVEGADNLAVTIGNLTFPAKILGVEPRKDIAILALVSPKALALLKSYTPFELAHTKELVVGQKTLAIGNPYGLDHSLTIGVVSALNREVLGIGGVVIHDMIQTDASINPGNSGGPLLDSAGRLIGINTVIYSKSGASAGIGFAVPADEISRIVDQIIEYGRPILAGIGINRLDETIAEKLGVHSGIVIGKIMPGSPADKAGMRATHYTTWGRVALGDVIIALNGKSIPNYDAMYDLFSTINVGDPVTVTFVRDGKTMSMTMKTVDIAAY